MSVAALFLTVAVLPASVLKNGVATGVSVSQDLFADGANIVFFEPGIDHLSGITADTTPEAADGFPAVLSNVVWYPLSAVTGAVSAAALALGGSSPHPSILVRLAALSTNRVVWLVALSPWIWAAAVWHVRPPLRRRERRRRR